MVTELASDIAVPASAAWARGLDPARGKQVAIWRAAYAVPETDLRPTGPRVDGLGWRHQRELDRRIGASARPVGARQYWSPDLPEEVTSDPSAGALERRLDGLTSAGGDVRGLITTALAERRPLPVENPADALWWRVVAAHAATAPHAPEPAPAPRSAQPPTPRHEPPAPSYARPVDRRPGIGR